ncbi:MAG: DUF92 domain-containing protein [Gemmatimonadaceae bacterium]
MAVALTARRAGSLASSGAAAAAVVGTVCVAAGWAWGAVLVAYFVASSALSRVGADRKAARTGGVVEKGGTRDATQVLANGGAFAAAALLSLTTGWPAWTAVGAGALAAAAADTWATETGTLAGGTPRSVATGRPVPPGTSGGVSLVGTLGGAAGAAFVALLAALAGWPGPARWAALVGGVSGMLADSLAGATLQARRRCERCGAATERLVHDCGGPTAHAGGIRWLDNDAVNVLCTLAGGAVGAAWARWPGT